MTSRSDSLNYLQEHNQNVFGEVNALNHRLSCSANEVAEYQAELMVASQEDEGATIRIQDLERRGALMEHGARRIHQRGMEIQEEYKDEVHHLQGLLDNTEARLQQLHQTNVLTTDIANRLYTEGQEMQTISRTQLWNIVIDPKWHPSQAINLK